MKTNLTRVLLLTVAMFALASAASACPVCFGNSDDQIVQGVEASVLFMMIVTYTVIIGGFGMMVLAHVRALKRRQAEQEPGPQGL